MQVQWRSNSMGDFRASAMQFVSVVGVAHALLANPWSKAKACAEACGDALALTLQARTRPWQWPWIWLFCCYNCVVVVMEAAVLCGRGMSLGLLAFGWHCVFVSMD
jgi:hypothetical protein